MSDRTAAREFFRHGRFRVTGDMIKARNRSIQLSTIEGVEVSRPLFLMALAGCAGMIGLGMVFGDLLYPVEIAVFAILGIGALALSWQVGALRVFSKLTSGKGWAVFWWIKPLHRMREAIEQAIEAQTSRRRRRNRGGSVSADDQDDGDDD